MSEQHIELSNSTGPLNITMERSALKARLAALETAALKVKEAYRNVCRCDETRGKNWNACRQCVHRMLAACASIAALVGEKETGGHDER